MADGVLLIQTGGTIDKEYPRTVGGYSFEISERSAAAKIIARLRPGPGFRFRLESVCRKDSQDVDDHDREKLVETILSAEEAKVIVTHGTDTMIQTALYVQEKINRNVASAKGKHVVFTGAFLPEAFKESDADFNLGTALGALQALGIQTDRLSNAGGNVFIAMGGSLIPAGKAGRCEDSGLFRTKS